MSFPTDWDVQKYFNPASPPIRWSLKKQFIETYKCSFPEEKLISLANVFHNMEFLGCRYSEVTTLQVNHLSSQVPSIIEYRKNKISKAEKTFVRASDAVKGSSNSRDTPVRYSPYAGSSINIAGPSTHQSSTEELKLPVRTSISDADRKLLTRAQSQPGWKGRLVIFQAPEYHLINPIAVCSNAITRAGLTFKFQKIETNANHGQYQLWIQDEVIASCTAMTEKSARAYLCDDALVKFKNYCFTILENNKFDGETIKKIDTLPRAVEAMKLAPDNIGAKIMKRMGWSGQGLGKDQDGIEEPILASLNVKRFGFGQQASTSDLRKHIFGFLGDYIDSMSMHSLIFSKEFSNEERKLIHEVARHLNLKSKSYGKEGDRQLIVQRKFSAWELVENLLANGGKSDNYTLIKPKLLT